MSYFCGDASFVVFERHYCLFETVLDRADVYHLYGFYD